MLIIYIAKGHWLAATFKLYGVVFLKVDFMQLHMCMSIVSCRSARVVARLSAITHDRLWSQLELHIIQYKSRGRRNCSVPPLPLTPQRGWRHCWTGREGQSSHRVHYLKVRQHCFIMMKYCFVFPKTIHSRYICLNHICVTMLLIMFNHLLSCFQQCLTGLGIFMMHGFDFGVGVLCVITTDVLRCYSEVCLTSSHITWCVFASFPLESGALSGTMRMCRLKTPTLRAPTSWVFLSDTWWLSSNTPRQVCMTITTCCVIWLISS